MLGLLQNFEPRLEEKGTIFIKELEEIQEVIFQEKGIIDVGYEVNRKARWVLRMNKGTIIGAYNCCENKKTLFTFRSATDVHGFMLRKRIWLDLLDSVPELSQNLKKNTKVQFIQNIYIKVMMEKRRFLKTLESNQLNDKIISVLDLKKKQKEERESLMKTDNVSMQLSEQYGGMSKRSQKNNGMMSDRVNLSKLFSSIETN